MNVDKLMQEIEGVNPGRYDCPFKTLVAIRDAAGGDALDTGADCFLYGFLKGQRAAKAEAKREKKRLLERDTSGWYAYLLRWLERNIDNERVLGLVGRFARRLDSKDEEAQT